jgi:oxygen-independent coproporphyrinogen-3 oxidase
MPGLYLHIPYCRKLCYYCDFHFTVSLKQKERLVQALIHELNFRKQEAATLTFNTIYLGGGTPSVLSINELNRLFTAIDKNYDVSAVSEVTFEANPDDLDKNYLADLQKYTPVNRLSIGVQSFNDRDLSLLNRRHSAADAIQCIERAKSAGFTNLNIDLIYGIPGMSVIELEKNLDTFVSFNIPHLSAYHLTIEPKTVFGYYQKKGRLLPVSENVSHEQFEVLLNKMERNGYEQYEISNFAWPGHYSKHNLGYWTGEPYLGFGPSAHSYSDSQRRWNIANNTSYCESIEKKRTDYFETENIDRDKAYNEYILTSLRTRWGIDIDYIFQHFGTAHVESCIKGVNKFIRDGILLQDKQKITLSRKGKLIADYIITELMIVE